MQMSKTVHKGPRSCQRENGLHQCLVAPNGVRPLNGQGRSVGRTTDKAPDKAPDNWTAFRVLSGALSGALSVVKGGTGGSSGAKGAPTPARVNPPRRTPAWANAGFSARCRPVARYH